jgi:homoserine trans-succinylase
LDKVELRKTAAAVPISTCHSDGQMLPFSRQLNITSEDISDVKDLKITARNLQGKQVNINSVLSNPPIIVEK